MAALLCSPLPGPLVDTLRKRTPAGDIMWPFKRKPVEQEPDFGPIEVRVPCAHGECDVKFYTGAFDDSIIDGLPYCWIHKGKRLQEVRIERAIDRAFDARTG